MKICYKSFDGREFNTEEECLKYEKKVGIKMYSPDGLTYDPNLAFAVEIDGAGAAERFIEMCDEVNIGRTGINPELNGLYLWSQYHRQFFMLESLTCKALEEYFKSNEVRE